MRVSLATYKASTELPDVRIGIIVSILESPFIQAYLSIIIALFYFLGGFLKDLCYPTICRVIHEACISRDIVVVTLLSKHQFEFTKFICEIGYFVFSLVDIRMGRLSTRFGRLPILGILGASAR